MRCDHQRGTHPPHGPIRSDFGRLGRLYPTARDDAPHRRTAEIEFMRSLPANPVARQQKLRFLQVLFARTRETKDQGPEAKAQSYYDFTAGIYLANSASRLVTNDEIEQVRNVLRTDPYDDKGSPVSFPQFVGGMSVQERLEFWNDVLVFNATLPPDHLQQEYILAWIESCPQHRRMKFYQFLAGELDENGRDMSLPADPRERAEFLEFLDTWGGDSRQCADKGTYVFSFWYHVTDGPTMWTLHIACLVIFVLFTIGLYSRVTSVLAWAASLCYIHRGQLILFGQDTMQTIPSLT